MIKGLSREKIVIVSTHILEEVTAVCNRAMVLAKGRVVSDGTPQSLMEMSPYHGAVTVKSSSVSLTEIAEAAGLIMGVEETVITEGGVTIVPGEIDTMLFTKVLELSQSKGWKVDSLYVESGRLDEVFRSLTEGEVR
jgi:ABC-2 type transport system ATP-binding protein